MKVGTQAHPKFLRLCRRLKIPSYSAAGILELMWMLPVSGNRLDGDLAGYEAIDLAAYVGWEGDGDELVDALVESGWLDRMPDGSLLVHDYADHRPDFVKKRAARAGGKPSARDRRAADSGHRAADNGDRCPDLPSQSKPSQSKPSKASPKDCFASASASTAQSRRPTSDARIGGMDLAGWLGWWNGLRDHGLVNAGVREEPIADAVAKAWNKIRRSDEIREHLADPEAIRTAIADSDFCRGAWFTLPKLLGGKNPSGELIIERLLAGAYAERRNGNGQATSDADVVAELARRRREQDGLYLEHDEGDVIDVDCQ